MSMCLSQDRSTTKNIGLIILNILTVRIMQRINKREATYCGKVRTMSNALLERSHTDGKVSMKDGKCELCFSARRVRCLQG